MKEANIYTIMGFVEGLSDDDYLKKEINNDIKEFLLGTEGETIENYINDILRSFDKYYISLQNNDYVYLAHNIYGFLKWEKRWNRVHKKGSLGELLFKPIDGSIDQLKNYKNDTDSVQKLMQRNGEDKQEIIKSFFDQFGMENFLSPYRSVFDIHKYLFQMHYLGITIEDMKKYKEYHNKFNSIGRMFFSYLLLIREKLYGGGTELSFIDLLSNPNNKKSEYYAGALLTIFYGRKIGLINEQEEEYIINLLIRVKKDNSGNELNIDKYIHYSDFNFYNKMIEKFNSKIY